MTNQVLIDSVREMHNLLFTTMRYRKLICATEEANTEGSVATDEFEALTFMRDFAIEHGGGVGGSEKLAHLQDALHAVLLADGLGGSLEAGQRHVAAVKEEIRRGHYESQSSRRAYHGLPPLSS